jgi:hypothetical protein
MKHEDVIICRVLFAIVGTFALVFYIVPTQLPTETVRKQNYELFINVTKHNISYEQYCYMSPEERAAFIARGNK